jgi:hypothetical protein
VISSTTATSYVPTSLTTGTTYEFKIEAKNEYGYSEYSETITLLTASTPAAPVSVTT